MLTTTMRTNAAIQPATRTDRERLLNMISTLLWIGLDARRRNERAEGGAMECAPARDAGSGPRVSGTTPRSPPRVIA
jgi:hypothetical protein